MSKINRHYYDYSTSSSISNEINKPNLKKDQRYVIKIIEKARDYLASQNITKYEKFTLLFKKYEFKAPEIKQILLDFKKNHQTLNEIFISRTVKNIKLSGINIIYNEFVIKYNDEFAKFLYNYIYIYKRPISEILISELKIKINSLTNRLTKSPIQIPFLQSVSSDNDNYIDIENIEDLFPTNIFDNCNNDTN